MGQRYSMRKSFLQTPADDGDVVPPPEKNRGLPSIRRPTERVGVPADRSSAGFARGSKRYSAAIGMIGLLVAFSTAAAPEPVPHRIVSLGPAITRQLCLLGAADRIVGVTTYCPDLPGGA